MPECPAGRVDCGMREFGVDVEALPLGDLDLAGELVEGGDAHGAAVPVEPLCGGLDADAESRRVVLEKDDDARAALVDLALVLRERPGALGECLEGADGRAALESMLPLAHEIGHGLDLHVAAIRRLDGRMC